MALDDLYLRVGANDPIKRRTNNNFLRNQLVISGTYHLVMLISFLINNFSVFDIFFKIKKSKQPKH